MADFYLKQPSRPIALNPANKGKFTEWCLKHGFKNVQQGAKHVLANKDKYSEEVCKMAQFAKNSKSWGKGDSKAAPAPKDNSWGADDSGDGTDNTDMVED